MPGGGGQSPEPGQEQFFQGEAQVEASEGYRIQAPAVWLGTPATANLTVQGDDLLLRGGQRLDLQAPGVSVGGPGTDRVLLGAF